MPHHLNMPRCVSVVKYYPIKPFKHKKFMTTEPVPDQSRLYEIEERAAIYEFDAGMTRDEATKRAYEEAKHERPV